MYWLSATVFVDDLVCGGSNQKSFECFGVIVAIFVCLLRFYRLKQLRTELESKHLDLQDRLSLTKVEKAALAKVLLLIDHEITIFAMPISLRKPSVATIL